MIKILYRTSIAMLFLLNAIELCSEQPKANASVRTIVFCKKAATLAQCAQDRCLNNSIAGSVQQSQEKDPKEQEKIDEERKALQRKKDFINCAAYEFAGRACSPVLAREKIVQLWLRKSGKFFYDLDDIFFALRVADAFEECSEVESIKSSN